MASTSYTYGSETYAANEDAPKQIELEPEVQSDDEDEQAQEDASSSVRKEEVWKELLLTANGRDKTFVCPFHTLSIES